MAILAASAPCARRDLPWMPKDRNVILHLTTLPSRTPSHQRKARECWDTRTIRRIPIRQSRAEPTMSRPTRCRNAAHTTMPELLGGDVSKATAGRSLESLLTLTTSSDTDLVKPSNASLNLTQLLSPCFTSLSRPSFSTRPFSIRPLHLGESTICGRGKRRIASQRGKSCHGPMWGRGTKVHTGQLYIRLVEYHRPTRRGGCGLGLQVRVRKRPGEKHIRSRLQDTVELLRGDSWETSQGSGETGRSRLPALRTAPF